MSMVKSMRATGMQAGTIFPMTALVTIASG
jgi:hypothetical protein